MVKICLVSLPTPSADEPAMDIPLGLAYISAYLKKHGFKKINLVDYNLHPEYDYDEEKYLSLLSTDANVYGIYCMTFQFWWLKKVAEYIRKVNSSALIVAGGPHPSARPKECLLKTDVDISVIGEGEKTMLDIIQQKPVYDINGICYKESGKPKRTSSRPFITNLDSLPFPDRDLVDWQKYKRRLHGKRAFHIVTLRGCPFCCSFCAKPSVGRRVRYRSVKNVLSEVDFLTERYGVSNFIFYDDIFTLRRNRVFEFCKAFNERSLGWRCWTRVDTIDYEMLSTMKDSGLTSITMGIESGDNRILRILNKGVTVDQNRRAILLCKELNIPVRASLIYGCPGETRESIENTIGLIDETKPDEWNISTFIPIPGSLIGDNPEKYGVTIKEDPYYRNYYHTGGIYGMVKDPPARINTLSLEEYVSLRSYMVKRLEEVCPRRQIQDTIQHLNL